MSKVTLPLDVLKNRLIRWLEKRKYSDNTVLFYTREFNQLESYMLSVGCREYGEGIGDEYLARRINESLKPRTKSQIKRYVSVWNSLLNEEEIPNRILPESNRHSVPACFENAFASFITDSKLAGNCKSTIEEKERTCHSFFFHLNGLGCTDLSCAEPQDLLKTILQEEPYKWQVIKLLLRHLHGAGYTNRDFSALVPRNRTPLYIPDTYSVDELQVVENSFSLDTPTGKRNYAIFKIAEKEALRSLDIASLKIGSIDFFSNHISLTQTKTDADLELPLFPDVKDALQDYINHGRPESDCGYVFLRHRAPYDVITRQNVYTIISKAIAKSGIDSRGRHRGGHILRASNATHKVNSGMPYEQVQKSLGHTSRETIRHYAALDVKSLRKCAVDPPPVTEGSLFSRFLGGESP